MEFKHLTKETDFNTLEMSKLAWDVYCYGKPYRVYRIEGYMHTQGGKWGENCYWAFPRDEQPSYENAVMFEGNVCNWSLNVKQSNSFKEKWGETRMRSSFGFEILRNGKVFYSFGANDMDYGIAKARKLMVEINEHPICFNEIDYHLEIVGRKIYWREQPAIIKSYSMNGNLWIVPDGIPRFKKCSYEDSVTEYMDDEDYEDGIAEDLFAPSIYWFRKRDYSTQGEV